MKVTEVKVFPVEDEKLRAFVSVVFDDCFMVNDIKVIEGREGRFISMPSRRKRNGRFKDIAHPLNSETRAMLEGAILDEYEREVEGVVSEKGRRPQKKSGNGSQRPTAEASSEGEAANGERAGTSHPAPPEETSEPATLEEVTEKHLSDTFWTS